MIIRPSIQLLANFVVPSKSFASLNIGKVIFVNFVLLTVLVLFLNRH
jgi:hypothetical protein